MVPCIPTLITLTSRRSRSMRFSQTKYINMVAMRTYYSGTMPDKLEQQLSTEITQWSSSDNNGVCLLLFTLSVDEVMTRLSVSNNRDDVNDGHASIVGCPFS